MPRLFLVCFWCLSLFCYLWLLSLGFLPSLPRSFLAPSRSDFATGLSGQSFLFPLLSLWGSLIMEALL